MAAVVGEHVDPQLETGRLGFRAGKYMASNDELRFTIRGRGGHGALRGQIDDTVSAAADLTLRLTALNLSLIHISGFCPYPWDRP